MGTLQMPCRGHSILAMCAPAPIGMSSTEEAASVLPVLACAARAADGISAGWLLCHAQEGADVRSRPLAAQATGMRPVLAGARDTTALRVGHGQGGR